MFKKLIVAMSLMLVVRAQADDLPLNKLKMPPGFKISVWAKVPKARSMTLAPDGRVFVGTRQDSKVYVVKNGEAQLFAEGLDTPNGVAFRNNKLYVAEVDRILEYDAGPNVKLPQKNFRELSVKFPGDNHHGWKFIRFGPDGKLYVPVGANCNTCDPKEEYARIYRLDVNGKEKEVVAQGIRNTVGFDWHPDSKQLWFTENGRDMMGDDIPPDEVNRVTKDNENFGFPFCYGDDIIDPEFSKGKSCKDATAPMVKLGSHVAALGMRFYQGKNFPKDYQKNIILAEHGSWNKSKPDGYRITRVQLEGSKVKKVETFIEGWLEKGKAWGRPVDVEVLADGSMLISDDEAGVIYKLIYAK